MKRKINVDGIAVFLDRDGTINKDSGYINHPERVELIARSARAIRKLNSAGIPVIIVTNQSGVARGYLNKKVLSLINKRLGELLDAQGAKIDAIYYCQHHPSQKCSCRKPKPEMLKKASRKFALDLSKCFVVGDKYSDIAFAHNVKASGILVLTGYGRGQWEYESKKWKKKPDAVVADLWDAVGWILKQIHSSRKK
ncbi:MAG: HAD family hydrolase [bacterium]